ncbi:MAG: recombinase [Oscillospiraceae bacterium]|nr:recombinase [Oscillospiraceae bacterium]
MNNVSEWVGHSETTTTMKFYAHLDDRSKQYSAELMESALKLPEGGNPPSWK